MSARRTGDQPDRTGDGASNTEPQLAPVITRNGVLVAPTAACIYVQNPAVTSAFGVYETLQVVRGRIFLLNDHLRRLQHSATAIGLSLPADLEQLASWATDLVEETGRTEGTLRVLALNSDTYTTPAIYMILLPPVQHPRRLYEEGASAITFEGERALPTAKTLNTLVNFLAQRAARAAGCHEGLLVARDGIREGATSNVFAVINDTLVTPPDFMVLPGVTREIVLRLAQQRGFPIAYHPLSLTTISSWQEAFLTSTSRHVMPLTRVNGQPINGGGVGTVTRTLKDAFEAYFWRTIEES